MFKEIVNIILPVLVYTKMLDKSLYYLKIFWLIYSYAIVICIEITCGIWIIVRLENITSICCSILPLVQTSSQPLYMPSQ